MTALKDPLGLPDMNLGIHVLPFLTVPSHGQGQRPAYQAVRAVKLAESPPMAYSAFGRDIRWCAPPARHLQAALGRPS